MNRPIPKRLRREPLVEAVWEMRLASDEEIPLGEMLPGIVYQAMRDDYPHLVRLPFAEIPRLIANQDPNLRYAPSVRLEHPENPFSIQIGQRVVTLSCRRPYAGWSEFSRRIRELAQVLRNAGLVRRPERFSLKYIDLLELDPAPSLASLDMSLTLGSHTLEDKPTQLRTEIREEPFIHVVQIATPVEVTLAGQQPLSGTLVDIDTIHIVSGAFWDELEEQLDPAHEASKRMFFNLLTANAEQRLDPEYA